MLDLLVVHSPVGGGHKAAALALAEAATARGYRAKVLDLFSLVPKVIGDAYVGTHLNWTASSPDTYGEAYFAANHRGGPLEPLRLKWDQLLFGALLRAVRAEAPRAIVATHHLPLVVLGRARRKGRIAAPVVGIVTDYTAHAVWAERGVDRFCVGSKLPYEELAMHGVDPSRIELTGIPVREAFERIEEVRAPAPGEPLRVLVTSGGFGVGPMQRIVRSFAGVENVELTVVCGKSDTLVESVRRLASEHGVRAEVVGFETNMPARLRACHLVVGKAGGLTVSETMTAGRAMLVVGTVPGNEMLNEAFVVGGGAGVAAVPEEVGAAARALRAQNQLGAMGARGRLLVRSHAAARVLGVVGQTLSVQVARSAA
ncbi:MAG TPA: glycosyltransferase [Polyangiaceae bacterium]